MALARIHLPEKARRGEFVEVRIVIQHPMETGFRRDAGGERVPRNAIHSLVCKYGGEEVFRATMSSGIAANPLLRFFVRAEKSGPLDFWWLDDNDIEGTAQAQLVVA
jgi:thiosulfate oxidation carrier complex protein SoxZ